MTSGGKMGHDVFISYASRDREVADAARAELERKGLRAWIAPRDILPGQDYGEAIIDGIQGSRLLVLIFSSAANESSQVRREVERAVSRGIIILPFRIEDVPPAKALEYFISSSHWLDALTRPLAPHLGYLGDVASQMLAGRPPAARAAPPVAASPPGRWRWAAGGALVLAALGVAGFYFARPGPIPRPAEDVNAAVDRPRMKIHFPGEVERRAARNTAVPNIARTIFTRRAVPVRSDKPLRLRAGPSSTASTVAVIGTDEVFRVAPRQGQWWPARLSNGVEGYVEGRWVNVLDREAGANKGG